jgi:hypothetical protein
MNVFFCIELSLALFEPDTPGVVGSRVSWETMPGGLSTVACLLVYFSRPYDTRAGSLIGVLLLLDRHYLGLKLRLNN